EVAAAQHVVIMCGSMKIDGYAFCLGLPLRLSYDALSGRIRSITYLIRGSIFRPKYIRNSSNRISLGIRPLCELIDMYHTHQATKVHDKVFALLGMSSDNPITAGLLPDYNASWDGLLGRLVRFLLGEQVSMRTFAQKEMAVINGTGFVLGKVSSVIGNANRDGRQEVIVAAKDTSGHLKLDKNWTPQASANLVQIGDLICRLHGASKPTVIRRRRDYFSIVMITVTPPEDVGLESGSIEQPGWPTISFPHEFLLVWDW
ncbi:hypothetical protein BKA56DRAFT_463050, partial [Ilyonectria sp. MPI-CAGE-AT-0026]